MVKLSDVRCIINYPLRVRQVYSRKGKYRVTDLPQTEEALKGESHWLFFTN